jgi:hypothetical protein
MTPANVKLPDWRVAKSVRCRVRLKFLLYTSGLRAIAELLVVTAATGMRVAPSFDPKPNRVCVTEPVPLVNTGEGLMLQ